MGHAASLISFVGHSGAGKTTLIEKLVRALTQRGLRVATLKHAHHEVPLDTPGKDSWRYSQAGAALSLLVTEGGVQLVATRVEQRTPQQLAARFAGDADVVLAEGFAQAAGAKIEVLRRACSSVPRCTPQEGLVAMVTDMPGVYPHLPHFALDDVEGIIAFILQRAGR